MKKLKWAVLLFFSAVVVLVLLLQVTLRVPRVQKALANTVAPMVGEGVAFNRIDIAFWPGLGAALKGVRVSGGPTGEGPDVMTADTISLILETEPLLDGEFQIKIVSIDGALFTLERKPDGAFPIAKVVDRFASLEDEPGDTESVDLPVIEASNSSIRFIDHAADGSAKEIPITDISLDFDASRPGKKSGFSAELSVASGTITLTGTLERAPDGQDLLDSRLDAQLKAVGLSAAASLPYLFPDDGPQNLSGTLDVSLVLEGVLSERLSGDGTVTMAAGGGFEWSGLRLGAPLKLKTQFDVEEGSRFQVSAASLAVSALAYEKFHGQKLQADLSYEGQRLNVRSAQLDFYGGRVTASGKFGLGGKRSFSGFLDVNDIDMEALADSAFDTPPSVNFETMTGRVEFTGADREGKSFLSQLNAEGQMRLDGGQIPGSSVIGAVGGGLLRIIPSVMRPAGSEESLNQTAIQFLEQSFTFRDDVFKVEKFSFVTDDYSLEGSGKIEIDLQVHIDTRLTFTPEGMQKLLISVAVPIPTGGIDILPAFPMTIMGSVENPVFVPDVTGIPFMALQILFSPLKGVSRALFGGIRSLGSTLTNW